MTAALSTGLDAFRDARYAPDAVTCPKCQARPGYWCMSTGGGNTAYVPTHKARETRVADWSLELRAEAGRLVKAAGRNRNCYADLSAFDFSRFEQSAKPVAPAKPVTAKGVRLSERQAEEIEGYVQRGGYGSVSTAHFHGDAQHRQTVNALEEKGIVEQVGDADHYGRNMRLTEFGWQVYDQHRLIIKRLTDAQVAEQRARAESGRCLSCGAQPGTTDGCDSCGLTRWMAADDIIKAFNAAHPVGTRVFYRTSAGEGVAHTRWCAFFSRDDVPSIRVEGVDADLLLSQVEPVGAEVTDLAAVRAQKAGAR